MSQDALGQLKHLKTARARWPFPDVQQNLYTARKLEEMAKEYHRQVMIEWERFQTRKFNIRMMEVIE